MSLESTSTSPIYDSSISLNTLSFRWCIGLKMCHKKLKLNLKRANRSRDSKSWLMAFMSLIMSFLVPGQIVDFLLFFLSENLNKVFVRYVSKFHSLPSENQHYFFWSTAYHNSFTQERIEIKIQVIISPMRIGKVSMAWICCRNPCISSICTKFILCGQLQWYLITWHQ